MPAQTPALLSFVCAVRLYVVMMTGPLLIPDRGVRLAHSIPAMIYFVKAPDITQQNGHLLTEPSDERRNRWLFADNPQCR